jgi:hypothetical protein
MQLEVTQDDIDQSKLAIAQYHSRVTDCPLACAIKRALNAKRACVTMYHIMVEDSRYRKRYYPMTDAMGLFANSFDANGFAHPATFQFPEEEA